MTAPALGATLPCTDHLDVWDALFEDEQSEARATAHRAGPASQPERITGMPMMIEALATCTSSEVATE